MTQTRMWDLFRPDQSNFIDPFNHPGLIRYYDEVLKWHGYVKFLGMPYVHDDPDVLIERLYVEPYVSRQYVNPDTEPATWPDRSSLLAELVRSPRLMILGDPGSGKSTLVSWLAWQLSRPIDNICTNDLGRLVPFPFILRELAVDQSVTWDTLVDSFLAKPPAKPLTRAMVEDILSRGQALIMLDGLDEIGSQEVRWALRAAVIDGFNRYENCRWILTSRIVGYDEVPFHELIVHDSLDPADEGFWEPVNEDDEDLADECSSEARDSADPSERESFAVVIEALSELRYVVPFDDAQIQSFAANWYAIRERSKDEQERRASDLVHALNQNEQTHRLARIPNILSFMAMIHRITAQLPHGRAMLYQQIAEAYLHSIDKYRGIEEGVYKLSQKRRWLAQVAFEMQLLRMQTPAEAGGILVRTADLLGWINKAMDNQREKHDRSSGRLFVDHISRRSGLLVPRAEGKYAFAHLSFQEYFAACYLVRLVKSPAFLQSKSLHIDMLHYSGSTVWRDTVVFLFELLAEESEEWLDELYRILFDHPVKDYNRARAELLSHLSVDPHSGLSDDQRRKAWHQCWQFEQYAKTPYWPGTEITRVLLSAGGGFRSEIIAALLALNPRRLDLEGCSKADLKHILGAVRNLCSLSLRNAAFTDLKMIAQHKNLQILDISQTSVSNLSPIADLTNLVRLNLRGTSVTDIKCLSGLKKLTVLDLGNTRVTDLSPLACLPELRTLKLSGLDNIDLNTIRGLTNLEHLDLSHSHVEDLSPLMALKNLAWLVTTGVGAEVPPRLKAAIKARRENPT